MADERITDYTLSSTLSASTLFEFVDTLDTTDPITGAATGSNKAISGVNLASQLLAGYTGGTSIATLGTVATGVWSGTAVGATRGGTGLTAVPTANQVLGSNAGATAYEGKTLTSAGGVLITHGTGTITLEHGTIPTLNVLANTTGGTASPAGATLSALLDATLSSTQGAAGVYRGASAWSVLAPSTAGFVLKTGGAAANPSWVAPRTPQFSCGLCAAVANTGSATSVFGSPATSTGTLTIPANRLAVGSTIYLDVFGTIGCTGTPTLTLTISLGGTTIFTAVSSAFSGTSSGKFWQLFRSLIRVNAIGASGNVIGAGSWIARTGAAATLSSCDLTTGGSGGASTLVTVDTTGALALDFKVTWSAADPANTISVSGCSVFIDG